MLTRYAIPAVVVLAVGGAAAWWFTRPDPQATAVAPVPAVQDTPAAAPDIDARVPDMTLGDPDAPITVVEYASFTCPHCANFHTGPFQQIKANFIDQGLVHFVNREVYFDRYGLWAGMVARCGGEERYHGIVEILYETQRQWAGSDNPAQVAENLRRIGRQAGMSNDQVDACLQDQDMALAMTATYQANAEADNIRATPTFMINGVQHANMSYAEFERVLNGLLED